MTDKLIRNLIRITNLAVSLFPKKTLKEQMYLVKDFTPEYHLEDWEVGGIYERFRKN